MGRSARLKKSSLDTPPSGSRRALGLVLVANLNNEIGSTVQCQRSVAVVCRIAVLLLIDTGKRIDWSLGTGVRCRGFLVFFV